MDGLTDKTMIVTGASRGIGRALSQAMARSGINLVLNARHDSPLSTVADECVKMGVEVNYLAGNAAQPEIASELVDMAMGMGSFFGFVHAAGVLYPGPFLWELTEDMYNQVMEASVKAGYELTRSALPHMRDQGEGLAVFFGSGAAEINTPGIGIYCVAKAAEEHMARQLAAEAPEITTLIYRPGVVETRMQEQARQAKGGAAQVVHEKFHGYLHRGELLTPEQAATALLKIMTSNPRRYHGRVATWRDGV
jgi:NAD(P)-dependent dehydrogenase (short-subunit alcohol dehydrogenase family)